jgi:hypothetical protein
VSVWYPGESSEPPCGNEPRNRAAMRMAIQNTFLNTNTNIQSRDLDWRYATANLSTYKEDYFEILPA